MTSNLIASGQLSAGDFAESMDLGQTLSTSPQHDLRTWQKIDQDVALALHLQERDDFKESTPAHPYFATTTKADFGGRSTMSDAALAAWMQVNEYEAGSDADLAAWIQANEYDEMGDQQASSTSQQHTGSSPENIPLPPSLRTIARPATDINGIFVNMIRRAVTRGPATARGRHPRGDNLQHNPNDFGPDDYEVGCHLPSN